MLTKPQLKNLASRSQQLKPVVIIGNNGLTENVHHEIETALNAHELVKIRLNAPSREERQRMIEAIVGKHQATKIQAVGHIVVVYRQNED